MKEFLLPLLPFHFHFRLGNGFPQPDCLPVTFRKLVQSIIAEFGEELQETLGRSRQGTLAALRQRHEFKGCEKAGLFSFSNQGFGEYEHPHNLVYTDKKAVP